MRRDDPLSWMLADALEWLRSTDRLRQQFFHPGPSRPVPCWEPPVDLYEQADRLTLLVAVPGVFQEQMEVVLEPAAIVVRGERRLPPADQQATIHRLEIPYGRFERRITLPPGQFQLSDQRLERGCIVLELQRLR